MKQRRACAFCRQPIKDHGVRLKSGSLVGLYVHAGCALRGSSRNETSSQQRRAILGWW